MSDRQHLIEYLYLHALENLPPLERKAVEGHVGLLREQRDAERFKVDGISRAWNSLNEVNERLYDKLTALVPDLELAADAIADYSLGGRTPDTVKELLALRDRLREYQVEFAAYAEGEGIIDEEDDHDPTS